MKNHLSRYLAASAAMCFALCWQSTAVKASLGSFVEEGIDYQSFYDAWSWCQNPSFSTTLPSGDSGAMLGINVQSSYQSATYMGYTVGSFQGSPSNHGTFVENAYQVGESLVYSFYPLAAPSNTNDPQFSTATNSNDTYYDAYINGALVVSNLFKGDATSAAMTVGLYDSATSGSPDFPNFPSFTNGSNCDGMQTYTTARQWTSWTGNPDLFYYAEAPTGQSSAHGVYNSSSQSFSVYYN